MYTFSVFNCSTQNTFLKSTAQHIWLLSNLFRTPELWFPYSIISFLSKRKPYFIRFPLDDLPDAKQTNLKFGYNNVDIVNIRGKESQLKLDDVGFELTEFYTALEYEDSNDFPENSTILHSTMLQGD